MNILQATISDAEEILVLQKLTYRVEAERYNDYNIPPLMQTLGEIETQFKDHVFLKAASENMIIGTVRAHEENGTCYIGKLAVYPEMQNRGIGTVLMQEIEKYYASCILSCLLDQRAKTISISIKNWAIVSLKQTTMNAEILKSFIWKKLSSNCPKSNPTLKRDCAKARSPLAPRWTDESVRTTP